MLRYPIAGEIVGILVVLGTLLGVGIGVHILQLPDELVGTKYYEYGPNKTEQAAKQYWEKIKQE